MTMLALWTLVTATAILFILAALLCEPRRPQSDEDDSDDTVVDLILQPEELKR